MLRFELLSRGEVVIDTIRCRSCQTRACVKNCRSSKNRPVLVIKDGIPHLDFSYDELKRGACVECLGCELDCHLYGNQAIAIKLPN